MSLVAREIQRRELPLRSAAGAIGVGVSTLERHLAGEHVRSDSAQKYRNWLEGRGTPQNVFVLPQREAAADETIEEPLPAPPERPNLVVDIFAGCGGLSLGFDLLGGGEHFRTILAVDNQAAPIAVLNRNAALLGHGGHPVGRQVDLTEFTNEAEFLTFFMEHIATVEEDQDTAERLDRLANGAFPGFRTAIADADSAYLWELNAARSSAAWQRGCGRLDRSALGQTSVVGFHEHLRLPRTSTRPATLPLVLWGTAALQPAPSEVQPPDELLQYVLREWDAAVDQLRARQEASGRGQLTASARRVKAFVEFLESPAMKPVRLAWGRWRARRVDLRAAIFDNPGFAKQLRSLYTTKYPVSVLVGGPPCQGFSRIGRGKIRSLRDALVHVHGNAEAGDARNLLFRQYVMVLEALRPDVFLFENVQHFQSTVDVDGVKFQATEVLAEAIANLSDGEVSYDVNSRVLDASKHGVPQTRQRYFMCGVRTDLRLSAEQLARVLQLPRQAEIPLSQALAGLPQPDFVGGESNGRDSSTGRAIVRPTGYENGRYSTWIRNHPDGVHVKEVDSHIARMVRSDDAAFFALMGPGKRWMDYRADDAPTVSALRALFDALAAVSAKTYSDLRAAAVRVGKELPDPRELAELRGRVDGSLSLRLLLEQAGQKLGEPHHLLTETYLAKRDGRHGDWVARMDAARPAKTLVSHMGKDTYAFVHPSANRTISVREAARVQTFPDWFSFAGVALTDAFKMIGNAVPPLLSRHLASQIVGVLAIRTERWKSPAGRSQAALSLARQREAT